MTYTKKQIEGAFARLKKDGGDDHVAAVLNDIGVASIAAITPDQYEAAANAMANFGIFADDANSHAGKSTAQGLADIADQVYNGKQGGGPGPKKPREPEPEDAEINPHHAVPTGEIDPTTIFENYNKIDGKTKQARAQGVKPE